ncbi:hypothetical protein KDA_44710 [Dictyobacter alpinus]|uniref:Uncharacterized protein n=1 Tax=Dictyobacter alpinus TaxID=2014873 RepID=A0A402BCH3_9CHLR|nr:hypothetical protein [Dictyobacter alpinus]GCE28987.1 hypothetical protein KDA_44710 [Dictyobacter alpinus]
MSEMPRSVLRYRPISNELQADSFTLAEWKNTREYTDDRPTTQTFSLPWQWSFCLGMLITLLILLIGQIIRLPTI